MSTAPAMAPPIDPSPPMTIMTRKSIETRKPNDSGTMRPNASARKTPPSPAYIELTVKAAAL